MRLRDLHPTIILGIAVLLPALVLLVQPREGAGGPSPQRGTLPQEVGSTAGPAEQPGPVVGSRGDVQKSAVRASRMTRIEIRRGGTETLAKIFGDGRFTYDAKLIDQSRLVVDLSDVSTELPQKVFPVDHPLLKRIRVGHHVDRVRLVFDLPRPVSYSMHSRGNYLGVHLRAAEGPSRSGGSVGSTELPERPSGKLAGKQAGKQTGKLAGRPAIGKGVTARKRAVISKGPARRPSRPPQVSLTARKPRLAQIGTSVSPRAGTKTFQGRRISLDFQEADITNVLRLIAEVSGLNVVIGQKVKAKVTMKLENVPWDQALDMILKMNNLGMVQEGTIVWIDTLANIAKQQDAAAKALESRSKAEPLVTKVIYVQNVKANDLLTTLKQHLSPRGRIQVDKTSNALVLQDTASSVKEFERLAGQLDQTSPQVQIEGRIVQADTSYARSFGIKWGFAQVHSGDRGTFTVVGNITGPFNQPGEGSPGSGEFETDFLVNLPAAVEGLSSIPSLGINTGKFLGDRFALDMRLSAGELLGLVKTLAAPKITTIDNQEAKIEQGESIPFQTTSLQGTQTTFVDANLALQVTPQVTSRDPREKAKNILMKVKVTRNSVGERSNPAGPSIDKKEVQTQVLVRDGETMVIGGIFVDEQRNSVGGVPYLSRIPVLGWLFKNKSENVSKQELLIFLTPTIVS